jgi:hypothetical protein
MSMLGESLATGENRFFGGLTKDDILREDKPLAGVTDDKEDIFIDTQAS